MKRVIICLYFQHIIGGGEAISELVIVVFPLLNG